MANDLEINIFPEKLKVNKYVKKCSTLTKVGKCK